MTEARNTPPADDTAPEGVRDRASHAYEAVREKAADTVEASRERAHDVAQRTAEAIETNPVAVLVGGLALGALAGAIIPRSQREKELLAPVGQRVNASAAAALAAAKEAGRAELAARGLTPNAAKDQARSLFDNVAKAVTSAGSAAARAGREAARSG